MVIHVYNSQWILFIYTIIHWCVDRFEYFINIMYYMYTRVTWLYPTVSDRWTYVYNVYRLVKLPVYIMDRYWILIWYANMLLAARSDRSSIVTTKTSYANIFWFYNAHLQILLIVQAYYISIIYVYYIIILHIVVYNIICLTPCHFIFPLVGSMVTTQMFDLYKGHAAKASVRCRNIMSDLEFMFLPHFATYTCMHKI